MSHRCPAPGCSADVDGDQLTCSRHWWTIPKPLRDELWVASRGGPDTLRHQAAVDRCVEFLERQTQRVA